MERRTPVAALERTSSPPIPSSSSPPDSRRSDRGGRRRRTRLAPGGRRHRRGHGHASLGGARCPAAEVTGGGPQPARRSRRRRCRRSQSARWPRSPAPSRSRAGRCCCRRPGAHAVHPEQSVPTTWRRRPMTSAPGATPASRPTAEGLPGMALRRRLRLRAERARQQGGGLPGRLHGHRRRRRRRTDAAGLHAPAPGVERRTGRRHLLPRDGGRSRWPPRLPVGNGHRRLPARGEGPRAVLDRHLHRAVRRARSGSAAPTAPMWRRSTSSRPTAPRSPRRSPRGPWCPGTRCSGGVSTVTWRCGDPRRGRKGARGARAQALLVAGGLRGALSLTR